jgi:3-deoxy-D-manno-octulosonic-acid transferase
VTAMLALYTIGTRLAEPVIPWFVGQRLKAGKERTERVGERFGVTTIARPDGPLLWLHGASVGESRLLLDLFAALRVHRPDVSAVVTTQTLTSADMIVSAASAGVIHQMAPVDAPTAVSRFLDHWRPDAAAFAEGEIWPNMLIQLRARGVPGALVNARMTTKTLSGWKSRASSAREIFSTFNFIGAADDATAKGLADVLARPIGVVGNLKRAANVAAAPPEQVSTWRRELGDRPIFLAASTHPGEDEFALDAFAEARKQAPGALLIIAPRHPARGPAIADLVRQRGLSARLRSLDPALPTAEIDVLVADTMGEMMLWYALSDGIYLGGATAAGVGGHNPIEPAQLGKHVFTGPHGFNFAEVFDTLKSAGAITIGETPSQLSAFWLRQLGGHIQGVTLERFFLESQAPFEASLAAVMQMLPAAAANA